MYIKDLLDFYNDDFQCVLFGVGEDFLKFLSAMNFLFHICTIEKNFEDCVSFAIDNNKNCENKFILNIPVKNLECLIREKLKGKIIITSSAFYKQISKQLRELGFLENQDYISYETYLELNIERLGVFSSLKEFSIFESLQEGVLY